MSGGDLRAWAMTVVALALTVYEAVARGTERPYLLMLYASMMGLPLLFPKGPPNGNGK